MSAVPDGTPVAWLSADNPSASDGAGYYLVLSDDPNDHQAATFGAKVIWVKNVPDNPGDNCAENNEGHWETTGDDS